jgi:hypothetical protein
VVATTVHVPKVAEGARRALTWAVHEAASRGGTVQAVMAWSWDGVDMPPHAATHPDQEREHLFPKSAGRTDRRDRANGTE